MEDQQTQKRQYILFYGGRCPFSLAVMPMIDWLEKMLPVDFDRREVWDNEDNERLRDEYKEELVEACGRKTIVPALVDVQARRAICNPDSYVDLNRWVLQGLKEE